MRIMSPEVPVGCRINHFECGVDAGLLGRETLAFGNGWGKRCMKVGIIMNIVYSLSNICLMEIELKLNIFYHFDDTR